MKLLSLSRMSKHPALTSAYIRHLGLAFRSILCSSLTLVAPDLDVFRASTVLPILPLFRSPLFYYSETSLRALRSFYSYLQHSEGTMAKTGYAPLCFLLVLATLAQCGLGQIGSTHVHNSATNDLVYWKYLTHDNDTRTVIPDIKLAQGTTEVFEVPEDVKCIGSSYFDLTSHTFSEDVVDWCKAGMTFDCLPDCYWTVDDTGFWVASSEDGHMEFVAAWQKVRGGGP